MGREGCLVLCASQSRGRFWVTVPAEPARFLFKMAIFGPPAPSTLGGGVDYSTTPHRGSIPPACPKHQHVPRGANYPKKKPRANLEVKRCIRAGGGGGEIASLCNGVERGTDRINPPGVVRSAQGRCCRSSCTGAPRHTHTRDTAANRDTQTCCLRKPPVTRSTEAEADSRREERWQMITRMKENILWVMAGKKQRGSPTTLRLR